jgi:hypothetical protein
MDESSAMAVVAVRAIETAGGARTLWSDADRAWASRAAAEVVGADATPEAFIARRAALALERIGAGHPAVPRALRALRWRPWLGMLVGTLAFALGLFLDQVDSGKRINILAPPVLLLLIWNLVVYGLLVFGFIVRYGDAATAGPVRGLITRLATGNARSRGAGGIREAIVAVGADWTRQSAPLYGARAARIMHCAAALLAAGVLAGLYLRGLAFEYQANWESTFLAAPTVRSLVAFAYAPGALLTGLAVPGVDAIAAIRAPAGENAARWLHLMAATVAAVVIVPRLLLAVGAGFAERRRAARFPLALDEPYFRRLLRGYRGGPVRVRVMPCSYTLDQAAITGLEAIVARAFGGSAALLLAPSVAYGSDATGGAPAAGASVLLALFSATATPEREVHGVFLQALAQQRGEADTLLALVDEGAFVARWGDQPNRRTERRAAWQALADEARVPVVFADLAQPDLAAADTAFDSALAGQRP